MRFGRWCLSMCACFLCFTLVGHANCPSSSTCYGPGLGSDELANTVVGGPSGNLVSYRFRAGHSGSLQQIHIYLMPSTAGYAAGTGGKIQITVNADDGTSAHNPSDTILASYLLNTPLSATPSINFPIFAFPVPPSIVQGQLYHIVFTNVDGSPATNYLSVNALLMDKPTTPNQPTISDIDSAELLGGPGIAWAPRAGYTPILQLDYQDGFTEGTGYMEVWVGAPQNVSGANEVRQTFTVTGASQTVASASIRAARVSGSDSLTVRLETGSGTLIEQGQVSAPSFPLTSPASHVWTTYTFSSAHTLLVGQTYNLVFVTPASSKYQVFPIRKGVSYGFQNTTYFPDGYAQFNPGGSWTGWTQWGVTNRTDSDLQFYFALAANDNQAPIISNVLAGSLSSSSSTITWTTDQGASSQVEYGTTTAYANVTSLDSNLVTAHSQGLSALTAATTYHYRVHSANASGTETVSGDLTFTTASNAAPAPTITAVTAASITASGAIVTWTTDQVATSRVEYGATSAYGSQTSLDPNLVTAHSQSLSGLVAATTYHYRVHSANAGGAETISGDLMFTTASKPATAPTISAVTASSITSSGATISWKTDQPATTQVEFGKTTAYGSLTTLKTSLVNNHSQTVSGLSPLTVYHYRVRSKNASGTQTISGDFTFTTRSTFRFR
jgi:hypothetical protein